MPQPVIRVTIVEDDSRLRRTFTDILDSASDCDCVGVFASGRQAIARIPPPKPDVLIMDVNLPTRAAWSAWLRSPRSCPRRRS